MTRSLWVTNDFPPRAGGIEQFLANLVARLEPSETLVLASDQPGAADHDRHLPYRVERIAPRPMLPTSRVASRVGQAIERHRPEVLVFGAAWPLGELASRFDCPTLALSHGHEAGMVRVGLGPLIRRVARRVDAMSVISAYTREALGPWADTRLVPLTPGVDIEQFHPAVSGAAVRRRHGIHQEAPVAVCVSRLVPRKGQDVLVEAWPSVRARVPEARLLIAGSGPSEALLRRRVHELDLRSSVTFAGPVTWPELPEHHAAGDVFTMPCRTRWGGLDVEGLGIVYLEAQACGRPVVAGRSGGAPDALVPGRSGLVVEGRSPVHVAEGVAALLADPGRRAEMGHAGRRFVEGRYAWPVVVEQLRRLLAELARSDGVPVRR